MKDWWVDGGAYEGLVSGEWRGVKDWWVEGCEGRGWRAK